MLGCVWAPEVVLKSHCCSSADALLGVACVCFEQVMPQQQQGQRVHQFGMHVCLPLSCSGFHTRAAACCDALLHCPDQLPALDTATGAAATAAATSCTTQGPATTAVLRATSSTQAGTTVTGRWLGCVLDGVCVTLPGLTCYVHNPACVWQTTP
jgi:hypothetical protein